MRLVFFGSGGFGLPTLEILNRSGDRVAAVVSQPDRPAGRGGKCRATPIKEFAAARGIPVLQPEKPNTPEFVEELASFAPDLAVVVAYGHLIKRDLLDVPRRGFVNLHASLLPAYRGAAPVPWAILSGETVSGATVFSLNERFDSGGILGAVELPILADDTSATYLDRLAPLGAELTARVVPDFLAGRLHPRPQDDSLVSRAPKFRKEDGCLDWNAPAADIDRKVRAFQPWPLAFFALPTAKGEVKVNVLRVEPAVAETETSAAPGTILAADAKRGLVVMAADRAVRLALFQPEGKRPMPDTEYLRGTKVIMR